MHKLTRRDTDPNFVFYVSLWDNKDNPAYYPINNDHPHNGDPDKWYEDRALWGSIMTLCNGYRVPVLNVQERQKDGWREHMPDWAEVRPCTSGWSKFVQRHFEDLVREFHLKIAGPMFDRPIVSTKTGLPLVELNMEERQVKDMFDKWRLSVQDQNQYILNKNISPLTLKASNSDAVWRKTLSAYFKANADGIVNIIAECTSRSISQGPKAHAIFAEGYRVASLLAKTYTNPEGMGSNLASHPETEDFNVLISNRAPSWFDKRADSHSPEVSVELVRNVSNGKTKYSIGVLGMLLSLDSDYTGADTPRFTTQYFIAPQTAPVDSSKIAPLYLLTRTLSREAHVADKHARTTTAATLTTKAEA